MSGIMGIYYLDDCSVDHEDLGLMVEVLTHRGPDGGNIWVDKSIGFGHRMLWTTPESLLENLPLSDQAGNLVMTCDARIDNRDELISCLDFNNCPPEKITDSQLILAAYEKWGEECPEHLIGDFAFAIWDKLKQSLFCARDHMGVKPFYYYYQAGGMFAFGSEIKAILCLREVPHRLDEVKVGDYLVSIFQDKSKTFYQDIFRLPPASSMTLSSKGMQIRSYWSLDPCRELRLNSDEEYATLLHNIFAEAVRCRLRSAFPIGSHISGGLDSSSVTCMAQKVLVQEGSRRPLHTFSKIFDAVPECDERLFIETVMDRDNLIPHYVAGDRLGPLSDLNKIFQYQDEAISAPTHFFSWELNEATQREGVRIILDGFDGDNTLSHGESYFTELMRKGQCSTLVEEVNEIQKLSGATPAHILRYYCQAYLEDLACHGQWIDFFKATHQLWKSFNISRRSLFLHHGFKPLLPQFVRRYWRALRGYSQPQQDDDWIVNRRFIRRIGIKKRIQSNLSKQPLTDRENHWQNITSGILTQGLEILDQYAAAFSLEARHPFMDKRLIEFCLSLPPEQKFHQGWSRYVMRRAMENILPEQIQWRYGKSDLSPSFTYGLLKHDRSLLDEVMQNHLESIANYVDTDALRKIHEELMSVESVQQLNTSIDIWLWKVAMFTLWLHHARIK
ncbi:MAG: lasso peptide isopeptide bond-forming cyclase [Rhizonema sp. NSF051]|nr:lasso peptide isopeptide bond-forming cyclase [Rhizonema sp. NSF051]